MRHGAPNDELARKQNACYIRFIFHARRICHAGTAVPDITASLGFIRDPCPWWGFVLCRRCRCLEIEEQDHNRPVSGIGANRVRRRPLTPRGNADGQGNLHTSQLDAPLRCF